MARSLMLCALLACLLASAEAVRIGDEQFGDETEGLFYVFAESVIHIINAEDLSVVKTLESDHNGNPFTASDGTPFGWGDVVYMERDNTHYVFANVRNEETDESGNVFSHVLVLDTVKQEAVALVRTGGRPVHLYGVPELNEMWTHADADGDFDVIHLDDVSRLHAESVKALNTDPNHGKLLVSEGLLMTDDGQLRDVPVGYATNTGEPHLFKLDLEGNTKMEQFDFPNREDGEKVCAGSHAISYSHINRHAYVEGSSCELTNGETAVLLEFDTQANAFFVHDGVTGALYESPDEQFVVASDKGASLLHVFKPEANGAKTSVEHRVPIGNNPGSPSFYPTSDNADSLGDYRAFFPLTRNTLKANLNAEHAVSGQTLDVTAEDYREAPHDCQYQADGRTLATNDAGEPLTPDCGSCAVTDGTSADDYDTSLSGMTWVDLQEVVDMCDGDGCSDDFPNLTNRVLNTGAIKQGSPYSYSGECAYGRSYRVAKRGGKYIATHADFPQPSVYFVDASSSPPSVKGFVETANSPSRITYVPNRGGATEASDDDDAASIPSLPAMLILGVAFAVALL